MRPRIECVLNGLSIDFSFLCLFCQWGDFSRTTCLPENNEEETNEVDRISQVGFQQQTHTATKFD